MVVKPSSLVKSYLDLNFPLFDKKKLSIEKEWGWKWGRGLRSPTILNYNLHWSSGRVIPCLMPNQFSLETFEIFLS